MKLCNLASGSSGNCTLVAGENTCLLVDVGISAKRVECGLREIGVEPESIAGILITHEHVDHINGLPVFTKRHPVPIYGSPGTIGAIEKSALGDKINPQLLHPIELREELKIGALQVHSVSISHDAAEPTAYVIEDGRGQKTGVLTDLGKYDETILEAFAGVNLLLLEANHDRRMLETGPYPYALKQRVSGPQGHLSNDGAATFLKSLWHPGLQGVILGHLSRENNYEELAYETVRLELLTKAGARDGSVPIILAKQNQATRVLESK